MTGVLDAPLAEASIPEMPTTDAPRQRATWSQLRVELRLARRQALRAWGSSLLVVTLVALPMALLSGGAIFAFSRMATTDQQITAELGHTDAWLEIVGGPDPSRWQSPSEPWWNEVNADELTGEPVNPPLPPIQDVSSLLPAGTRTIEIGQGILQVETPGGIGALNTIFGPAWDPALAGRFELLSGRIPDRAGEAMVSPGALTRLEAEIGDTLTLSESRATFTIVGVLKVGVQPNTTQTLFLPSAPAASEAIDRWTWFAPDWQPTLDELPALNHEGVIVFARDLVKNTAEGFTPFDASTWWIATAVAVVAAFCAYLVILLAGTAFAVSARRQQRALAVAASVGAPRQSIFRIVVLQGTVLGVVGGVIGAAIGFGIAALALRLLDDGNVASFWGFNVPWPLVIGVVVFAIAVGTASALVPARAATKGDVLAALRGARRPVSVRADRPLWGSLLVVVGLGITVVSGLLLGALNAAETINYDDPMRTVGVVGIIGGPLLFQIGVVLAGHWILAILARVGARVSLSLRIATRDAAANPSRVVPAFGAIAACVFIASFAVSIVGINLAAQARHYVYYSPLGTVRADIWTTDADADALENRVIDDLNSVGARSTAIVRIQPFVETTDDSASGETAVLSMFFPAVQHYIMCSEDETRSCLRADEALLTSSLYVIAPDELEAALGAPVPIAAFEAFERGDAIVLPGSGRAVSGTGGSDFVADGAITINEWTREFLDTHWEPANIGAPIPDPVSTTRLPAVEVHPPVTVPWQVIISPEAARELGIPVVAYTVIGAFDTPPTQATLDGLRAVAELTWSHTSGVNFSYETGPAPTAPWLWLILGATGVLVLGAGAVTLGLARFERRPDDATLTAVGAPRRLRRGIAFWQGIIIVGVGSVTGTVAGIIPAWGFTLSTESLDLADTPWAWLVLLAFGLPLLIATVNWLVPPRHPDLTRRTAIA